MVDVGDKRKNKDYSLDGGKRAIVVPFTEIRRLEEKQAWIWGFKVLKRHPSVSIEWAVGNMV